jgi:hypothetical protein
MRIQALDLWGYYHHYHRQQQQQQQQQQQEEEGNAKQQTLGLGYRRHRWRHQQLWRTAVW